MNFPETKYINWIRENLKTKVDYPLVLSGIRDIPLRELAKLGFSLKDIETKGTPLDLDGLMELKETIAQRYQVKAANVTLCAGASMGMFLASVALLNPGDEAIVEEPCYPPLLNIPLALGCRVKRLNRPFENAFQPELSLLKKLLTKRVKLIYLTNLHNPSGARISQSDMVKIASLTKKVGAYVISNEIYMQYMKDNIPPAFKLSDNVISMASLTKAYGLGWVRAGWVLSTPELASLFNRIIVYLVGQNSYPSEKIALFAFRKIKELQKYTDSLISINLPILRNWMEKEEMLEWVEPAGGAICFPRLPKGIKAMDFVAHLKKKYSTLVAPGEFFSGASLSLRRDSASRHFRLGFGAKTEILKEGLSRISRALLTFRAR